MSRKIISKICFFIVMLALVVVAYFVYDEYDRRQLKVYRISPEYFFLTHLREDILKQGYISLDVTPAPLDDGDIGLYKAIKNRMTVRVVILKDGKDCGAFEVIPGVSEERHVRLRINSEEELEKFFECRRRGKGG